MGPNGETFLLLLKGEGDGCGYTIKCNVNWYWLSGESVEEALAKAREIIKDYADPRIEKASLIELKSRQLIDVAVIYRELKANRDARVKKLEEEEEKAELARLRAKWEKT